MTAERLASLLQDVGLDPTEPDLLDLLWLAPQITPAEARSQPGPDDPAVQTETGDSPGPPSQRDDGSLGPTEPAEPGRPERSERSRTEASPEETRTRTTGSGPASTLHSRRLSSLSTPGEGLARAIRVPAASILTDQLDLVRAMRPLKRRVPSRRSTTIDEEATATRIAEEQLWIPAMRPARTRWLELAVVVDGYESMDIWQQMVGEFRVILEGLGAFRDVRFWLLGEDASQPDRLGVRVWGSDSPLRSTRELIDPTGRRAIIMFTDFLGPLWRSGAGQRLLGLWGRSQPAAVLQPMPQRLWDFTNVRVTPLQLHAHRAGVPNSQLTFRDPLRSVNVPVHGASPVPETDPLSSEGGEPEAGQPARKRKQRARAVPVPVLELNADWLASWSRLLNGSTPVGVSTLVVLADETPAHPSGGSAPRDPSAEQRLQRFRASTSPEAFQLAVYMAAAPISLPVIRLVQRAMFKSPARTQLAEVIFGGLLRRTSVPASADPDDIEYDFHHGVRDLLLRELHRSDALDVLIAVSDFVDLRFGQGRDFRALLAGEGVTGDYLVSDDGKPFALVARRVLQLLSGHYAISADRIATAIEDAPSAEATAEPVGQALATLSEPMALEHRGTWRRPADDTVADPTLRTLSLQARRSRGNPLVCPYCYHAFRDRDILFRCSGRMSALGEKCPGERDELLAEKTGTSDSLPPIVHADGRKDEAICSRCHGPTRVQVCPDCHSRLPANFREVQGRLIALAGASDVGKTAFMTVLIHELRHEAGELLNSATIGADDTTQDRYVSRYERPLYKQGRLHPHTTTQSGHIQPLVFRFTMDQSGRLRRRRKELLLSFMDGAGEDLVSLPKTELVVRYLTVADSVLVLVDPLQLPKVRGLLGNKVPLPAPMPRRQQPIAAFNRITELLLAGAASDTIDKPVAIVLTKVDALWSLLPANSVLRTSAAVNPYFDSRDSGAVQTEIINLLAEWGAAEIERLTRNHFTKSHFFAVSAFGSSPNFASGNAPRVISPHRVTDPFIWLLNEFSFLSSR